ncbi:MAG TPA: hypothetical protein VMV40_02225 [Acidiferrobacter sp.]|nr:hypothetical protein [Acidiferrobacter sp.]
MSPFNKRLAPPRVFGLPLAGALAGLVTIMGTLLAVVLPDSVAGLALLTGAVALPLGILATWIGDDLVFSRVFWVARSDHRLAARALSWL